MTQPVIWCIGGIDSSGGAGVTRDALTLADLHLHTCVITTQITVQSNTRMLDSHIVSPSVINEQWLVLENELPPRAIKIGAIANDEQALVLCARIDSLNKPKPFIVWDPVLCSTSGGKLTQLSTPVVQLLLKVVDVVTPNIDELSALTGMPISDNQSKRDAIAALLALGANAVLAKGGHATWQSDAIDTFKTNTIEYEFSQPRAHQSAPSEVSRLRGTGCMQASALAAFIVKGYAIDDALTLANAYVMQVRTALHGHALSNEATLDSARSDAYFAKPVGFPAQQSAFPQVFFAPNDPVKWQDNTGFAPLSETNLGIYPVVDHVDWIAKLLPTGVRIIQLRIKLSPEKKNLDQHMANISQQIKAAVALTKGTKCQLFINDFWQLAIKHGAYGVHLGQEDLATADLQAIKTAGLRLGVSTHGFAELQRVKMLKPSYIALGHIFPTTTKDMPSQPQGITRLQQYVDLCDDIPTVAIGGINLSRVNAVANTGVNSIAVVTAITQADNPIASFHALAEEAGFVK